MKKSISLGLWLIMLVALTIPAGAAIPQNADSTLWKDNFVKTISVPGVTGGIDSALQESLDNNIARDEIIDYMFVLGYPHLVVAFSFFQQARDTFGHGMLEDERHQPWITQLENDLLQAGISHDVIEAAKYMIEAELALMQEKGLIFIPTAAEIGGDEKTGLGYGDRAGLDSNPIEQAKFNTGGQRTYASPSMP